MRYLGTGIQTSSVISEIAGSSFHSAAFLLVKYDEEGKVILCDTQGEMAAGLLVPATADTVQEGEDVTIQIKDIGICKAGAAIQKGKEITTDTQGRCIPANTGDFVIGYAASAVEAAGELVQLDIRKSGYKAL